MSQNKEKKIVSFFTYLPCATSAYSLVTALDVTMLSPLGASPQPPGPKALFKILLYLISGRYKMPSGLISTSSGVSGWSKTSAASFEKGWVLSPWKERVQSMADSPSAMEVMSIGEGSSERPEASVWILGCGGEGVVVAVDGAGFEALAGADFAAAGGAVGDDFVDGAVAEVADAVDWP